MFVESGGEQSCKIILPVNQHCYSLAEQSEGSLVLAPHFVDKQRGILSTQFLCVKQKKSCQKKKLFNPERFHQVVFKL